jgi:hypothetical protein
MSAELEFELNTFNSVADLVVQKSERTFSEFINGQGLAVASRAIKHTIKANAEMIAHKLGQIGTVAFKTSTKTGRLIKNRKRTAVLRNDSYAARIINARRKAAGQPLIWGAELDEAARKFIARSKSSVGFIKSGWVWAIKKLAAAVGYKSRDYGDAARVRGAAKGNAIPAQGGLNVLSGEVVCTIINSALLEAGKYSHGNPMPIAEAGLTAALNETSSDMLQHLADKLKPIFDQHSAK